MKPFILLLNCLLILLSCSKKEGKFSGTKENLPLNKAYTYYDANKVDSAYIYFNNAQELALQQKDSVTASNALIMMGMIATNYGDHLGAQDLTFKALSYLNKNDTAQYESLESCLSNLGNTSFNLEEYDEAIEFYNESLSYSKNNNGSIITKNALANAYREKKDYQRAMKIQQEILRHDIDKVEYARILSNLTYTKWLNNPSYVAQTDLLKALSIRLQNNDRRGLNASYSHLADYYENKQPDSALFYANRMYQNATGNKSPDDRLDALQKLVKLSPSTQSKSYFLNYLSLNDSILNARNISKNQFAVIRYQVEKHKNDFLKAEAENTKKQNKIVLQYLALALLLLLLGFGYFWYRKRKKTLQQEKELEVKNTEIKYVKKVHDHVANRIYQVMDEIDNRPEMEKEEVADKLEVIYQITRDLSYEASSAKYQTDFAKSLDKMFSSYQSIKVNITISGNNEQLWTDIQESVKSEVFDILQELMTNMSKHSQATEVELQLERNQQSINIIYHDNGIGIQKDAHFGNGLKNTETRIQGISGNITFENNNGLQINMTFPVA